MRRSVNLYDKVTVKNGFYFRSTSYQKNKVKAMVFDLDGTLTLPVIDFNKMRTETAILEGDLLDKIYAVQDKNERDRLFSIIHDIEEEARDRVAYQPNLESLINYFRSTELYNKKLAIVTRNSAAGLDHFKKKLGKDTDCFNIYISRDFLPYKPHPGSLLHISKEFDTPTKNILMVGDSHHDIAYGKAAGAQTCLFTTEEHWTETHDKCVEEDQPDYVIHDLMNLKDIVQQE
ncbi:haloacid dehalogenase [Acrasis kona]|uniref:Haloacid dehalogenase n=1 Tax=Acrasis kona TaxID=1008807 RepID=A0AAW2ZC04_9EUKA